MNGRLVRSEPTEEFSMTTTKPSMKPPTLADLDALPPGIVGEIIEGVLYTMTKPRARHQLTTTGIGGDLRGPFYLGRGGPGGWWIITEPGIELPPLWDMEYVSRTALAECRSSGPRSRQRPPPSFSSSLSGHCFSLRNRVGFRPVRLPDVRAAIRIAFNATSTDDGVSHGRLSGFRCQSLARGDADTK